jgi:hypothetical protein
MGIYEDGGSKGDIGMIDILFINNFKKVKIREKVRRQLVINYLSYSYFRHCLQKRKINVLIKVVTF